MPQTIAQKIATTRNFLIFQVRGSLGNLQVISERLCQMRHFDEPVLTDEELESLSMAKRRLSELDTMLTLHYIKPRKETV